MTGTRQTNNYCMHYTLHRIAEKVITFENGKLQHELYGRMTCAEFSLLAQLKEYGPSKAIVLNKIISSFWFKRTFFKIKD